MKEAEMSESFDHPHTSPESASPLFSHLCAAIFTIMLILTRWHWFITGKKREPPESM